MLQFFSSGNTLVTFIQMFVTSTLKKSKQAKTTWVCAAFYITLCLACLFHCPIVWPRKCKVEVNCKVKEGHDTFRLKTSSMWVWIWIKGGIANGLVYRLSKKTFFCCQRYQIALKKISCKIRIVAFALQYFYVVLKRP